jgi:hypothetical protein
MESVGNKLKLSTYGLENENELDLWIRNQSILHGVAGFQFEAQVSGAKLFIVSSFHLISLTRFCYSPEHVND